MKRFPFAITTLTGSVFLAACGVAPDGTAPTSAGEAFTSTVVTANADGTFTQKQSTMTLEQELAENEARVRAAASPASEGTKRVESTALGTCATTELWLYDAPNETGNRLCLQNATNPPPSMFALGWVGWSGRVRSYWPGSDYGYLRGTGCTDLFVAWEGRTNEVYCTAATGVELGAWPIQ